MAGNEELTIAQAAVIVGGPSTEAARRRVERAIRDNKLAWHPGPGGTRKLIYRGDLVAWITAPSDELLLVEDNNVANNHNNNTGNNDHLLDITSENHSKRPALGWREAAWGLAGIAWQQGREVEHLRGELSQAQQRIGEERGRRLAAEQRAQAAADEAAALREQAVHIDAARQEPPRRGWWPWRWGKG